MSLASTEALFKGLVLVFLLHETGHCCLALVVASGQILDVHRPLSSDGICEISFNTILQWGVETMLFPCLPICMFFDLRAVFSDNVDVLFHCVGCLVAGSFGHFLRKPWEDQMWPGNWKEQETYILIYIAS